ncbi:acyl carrier protein [Crossiella equi]|uniref:Acyl carrier protein n=1 Tax=Crossiella equi TaxID=130796 RepID=A0ABS5A7B8_9PSEU|nr:acyl carrier protein [Crossiella equi]MBP2472206.1 acyl carrier protein [Crossiella equi]
MEHSCDPASVRAAFAAALGREDFTDEESFFRVGGHSLRAVHVMKAISAAVGTRLPVKLLFDHPSVAELTEAIDDRLAAGARP